ncbi:DUF4326 domain-containing protein [Salinibaculum rarum]|uniref:DUF4326 domain-containing protein n=1 Tax=Salinibaculum rarum TaxID=3058903 RepID=UPI00265FE65C|nr:DUF4326 domain-containing protein [Salinibaculum sp. KK48]
MAETDFDPALVAHCKHDDIDVYVGREDGGDAHLLNSGHPPECLGNPWTVSDVGREESVERYREVFSAVVETSPAFREQIRGLAGETLGCFCQHADEDDGDACHAEVIAETAARLAAESDSEGAGSEETQAAEESVPVTQVDGDRVIIAGSRGFGNGVPDDRITEYVDDVVAESGFDVGAVVSGTARGADEAGEMWADANDVPVARFAAWWDYTEDKPDAELGTHSDGGDYWKKAGVQRNERMAEWADKLVLLWDGDSPGSRNMKETAEEILGEENVHVHIYQ